MKIVLKIRFVETQPSYSCVYCNITVRVVYEHNRILTVVTGIDMYAGEDLKTRLWFSELIHILYCVEIRRYAVT